MSEKERRSLKRRNTRTQPRGSEPKPKVTRLRRNTDDGEPTPERKSA